MTTKFVKTVMAGFVVATLGTASMTVPAAAGGSISISVLPSNAKDEQAMRLGLGIYALVQGVKNGSIKQHGIGNSAGLAQNGKGNLGIVHQEGRGHNGSVSQNGNGNAYGLFQFGRNTNGHATQNGNGRTGATFQFGW